MDEQVGRFCSGIKPEIDHQKLDGLSGVVSARGNIVSSAASDVTSSVLPADLAIV